MNAEPPQPAARDDPATRAAPPRPRPLVLPALAFMAGIIVSEFAGPHSALIHTITLVIAIAALVMLGILTARRRAAIYPAHALLLVAALGFGYTRHQYELRLPANHIAHVLTDEPILTRVVGRIVIQPTMTPAEKRNPFLPIEPAARTRFVLAATELRTSAPPTPVTGFISVSVEAEELDAAMGDTVVVTGKLYRPFGPRNPGETDWARWNRLQRIYASLSVEAPVHVHRIEGEQGGSLGLFAYVRGYAQGLLFEPFAEDESDQSTRLLDAMVLGHRSAAGRQLNEAFLRTGTIHFLTVSGFHVGVLAGATWILLRRGCKRGARTTALATMFVTALYALVVEHNAPILRATTMIMLACLAQLTRRPLCGLNWLALSALCILAYNPLELFRAGFQLSFVQVLAILTVVMHVYRWLFRRRAEGEVPPDADTWRSMFARWIWRRIVGLICVCVIAWLVSLPLVLLHFGRFAPWGALQSMLISPLVMLTNVLGFLTLIAQMILTPLGGAIGLLLHVATDLLLWGVEQLSRLPHTLIEVRPPPAAVVIATNALLVACIVLRRRRATRRNLLAGAMAAGLWLGWIFLPATGTRNNCAVHVLSVGSGTAILVTAPDRHTLLYDAGTMHNFDAGETVVRAARTLGIRKLDAVAISHANFDHYSGVPTVLDNLLGAQLMCSTYFQAAATNSPVLRGLLHSLPSDSPPITTLRAGDRFTFGSASVEVLWPPNELDESWRPNDRPLVLRIEANGRSVLLPADAERAALRALLARHESGQIDLRSDVLIAPHHGAVVPIDTAAFLEAVEPQVVINSSSRPRPKLTRLLHDTLGDDVRLLSTNDCGAITVRITPAGSIEIETPFASQPRRTRD